MCNTWNSSLAPGMQIPCCDSAFCALTLLCCCWGQCLSRPKPILFGYAAQYVVKPLLGYAISQVSPIIHPQSNPGWPDQSSSLHVCPLHVMSRLSASAT